WINGFQTVNGNPTVFAFVGALSGRDHLAYIQFPISSIPDTVQIDSVLTTLSCNNTTNSSLQTLEINDVKVPYGPYSSAQAQDSTYLDDFNNGTYATFDVTSPGSYGPINLGAQGAIDLRINICRDTFQFAMVSNNQSWKRFTSSSSSIDVYYSTCSGAAPSITETFHQDLTCVQPSGASTVSLTGNGSLLWPHNGDTSASQTGMSPGNYAVFANNSFGCGDVLCISILDAQPILATITPQDVSCAGGTNGSAAVVGSNGTAPYMYTWSTSDTGSSVSGLTPGTYSVVTTDVDGCTDSTSFVIGAPSAISVSTNGTAASCNGYSDGQATASASGGTGTKSYVWSNGDSTATANSLSAGTYYVTVTDQNGCTQIDSVAITEPAGFSVAVTANAMVSCNGLSDGAATANASGGGGSFSYQWNNSANTAMATNLAAGTYTVTITDLSSSCIQTDSVTVTAPSALTTATMASAMVSCNGLSDGAATVSANGGTGSATFLWSTSDSTASVSNLAAGTYTVTATDSNGCTETDSVTITEPTALSVVAVTDTNVSCNGLSDGAASVTASGGTGSATFLWSTSDMTASVSNLVAGTYTVTATDSNGCTMTDSVTITEPAAIDVSVTTAANVITANLSNATYQWLDCDSNFTAISGATSQAFTATNSGNYAVEITVNGCSDTSACTNVTVVGIEHGIGSASDFAIYPNPSTGQIMFSIEGQMLADEEVRIFSLTGQFMYKQLIEAMDTQIDLSTLSAGIYVVQYRGETKKLVLRR
ncbi:MAG: T9SS type A sorting domain-containing protein, partial [Bacteroidota bacterium]